MIYLYRKLKRESTVNLNNLQFTDHLLQAKDDEVYILVYVHIFEVHPIKLLMTFVHAIQKIIYFSPMAASITCGRSWLVSSVDEMSQNKLNCIEMMYDHFT